MEYTTRTEHYQKVKKPLLERQRRAKINKCLDALKQMVAEFQKDEAILRMDRAEMLETTIAYLRESKNIHRQQTIQEVSTDSFRHGYMNAANEVSRVLASTPGVTVDFGKSIMTHLGSKFNRLQQLHQEQQQQTSNHMEPLVINTAALSPASSGYHTDLDSPAASPVPVVDPEIITDVWRPW